MPTAPLTLTARQNKNTNQAAYPALTQLKEFSTPCHPPHTTPAGLTHRVTGLQGPRCACVSSGTPTTFLLTAASAVLASSAAALDAPIDVLYILKQVRANPLYYIPEWLAVNQLQYLPAVV